MKKHRLGVSLVAGDLAQLSAVLGRVLVVAKLKARPLTNEAVQLFEHLPKLFLVCLCVCGHVLCVFVSWLLASSVAEKRQDARRRFGLSGSHRNGPPTVNLRGVLGVFLCTLGLSNRAQLHPQHLIVAQFKPDGGLRDVQQVLPAHV